MLSINNEVIGDVCQVVLVGRIDVKAARDAEVAFAEAASSAPNVVLDFSGVDYIASAGLRALKRLRGNVKANGGKLILRGVQEDVMEIFEMTGFAAMLFFD